MHLSTSLGLLVTFCLLIPKANLQFPMQIYQMPPIIAFPPPLPPPPPTDSRPNALPQLPSMSFQIALPVPIPVKPQIETTTTERTEMNVGLAVPIQIPYPSIQVAIPAQSPPDFCRKRPKPPSCPVCPPCTCNPCVPSFFAYCSPCHQKCRCRSREETPIPIPRSRQMPEPYSSLFRKPHRSNYDRKYYKIMDDSDSVSAEWMPRYKHKKKHMTRRSRSSFEEPSYSPNVEISDDSVVRPVLSYLTRDGAVKLEKVLSADEAEDLLKENSIAQRVVVTAEEDAGNRQNLRIVSQNERNPEPSKRSGRQSRRRVFLNSRSIQHMLAEGKKELIFSPPVDKKISNLSVSFQITE